MSEIPVTSINICTMGHVDHGKTTFMAALTLVAYERSRGVKKVKPKSYDQIDSAPEEKARGITINASSVNFSYLYDNTMFDFCGTDCPGHRDFIKNAIVGASQNDGVLLIVSAADGYKPQTREHIILSKSLGIKKMIIVINKCDLIEEELIEVVEMSMKELLAEYGFDVNSPIMRCSAVKALNGDEKEKDRVEAILVKMCEYFKPEKRDVDGPFLLYVESVFTKTGRGTVITGKVKRGVCKIGDTLEIVGLKVKKNSTVVIGLEIFREPREQVSAGDNVGILLRGIQRDDIRRGQILAKPGSIVAHDKFKVQFLALTAAEGGRDKGFSETFSPQVFSGTANVTCKFEFPEGLEFVNPGDNVVLTVQLLSPLAVEEGMTITFRDSGKTIASGKIIEIIK